MPPYILYVARAFSTLEGIGLSANDDYSIVSEAFPYLSQRLLTDESPRAKAALRSMVYGTSEESAVNEKTPSLSKLVSIGEGFTSYSSATSSAPADQDAAAAASAAAKAEASARSSAATAAEGTAAAAGSGAGADGATAEAQEQLVDLLLSANGSYVQELILEEAAKLTDAAVREAIKGASASAVASRVATFLRAPKQLADNTVGRLPDLPGPLKALQDAALAPANALNEIAEVMPTLAAQNATDEATLKGFGELWESVAPALEGDDEAGAAEGGGGGGLSLPSVPPAVSSAASRVQAGPLFSELSDPNSRLRHRLPMVGTLSRRFGATLLRRVATRLEEDAAQPGAPGLARSVAERAAAAERSIADLLEPEPVARK